ncbi:MAG: hypothetical protein RLZ12_396 [Bacillota bacterium]|jgi:F-type H+-transporting ATPase subunit delta
MSDVAKRYARGLFLAAQEAEQLKQVEQDLALLAVIFGDTMINNYLSSPIIEINAKGKLLAKVLQSSITEISMRFLYLLLKARRTEYFEQIKQHFINFVLQKAGKLRADVWTAVLLSKEQRSELERSFFYLLNKPITLFEHHAPLVLGGVAVRIGDRLYDGTLRTQLRQSLGLGGALQYEA